MNKTAFEKICAVCSVVFTLIALLVVWDIWQGDRTFSGPPSPKKVQLLAGSIFSLSLATILPLIMPYISGVISLFVPGKAKDDASQVVALINTIMGLFGVKNFSASWLVDIFSTLGLPEAGYGYIRFPGGKVYAGGFGPLPADLPAPPGPPPTPPATNTVTRIMPNPPGGGA